MVKIEDIYIPTARRKELVQDKVDAVTERMLNGDEEKPIRGWKPVRRWEKQILALMLCRRLNFKNLASCTKLILFSGWPNFLFSD